VPRRYTPRIRTFTYIGTYRYSWTICTHQRRRIFVTSAAVESVLSHFFRESESQGVAVLAYCFMPDHLHLLIAGDQATSSAIALVNRAKQTSGYWFKREHGLRLWQRTGWDRVLRSSDDTWSMIRYILGNPVRAGLVDLPLAYPYSGSLVYTREQLLEAVSSDPAG
jgi:putative transposase